MPFHNDEVENICSSLVREYLSRKGLTQTLQCMDDEMPRTEASLNNRATLAREANLDKLLKKNKEQDVPLRTMLEVLLKHHKDRMTKKERAPSITSEVTSTSSTLQSPQDQGSLRKSEERKKKAKKMETRGLDGLPQEDTGLTYKQEDTIHVTMKDESEVKRVATPMQQHTERSSREHDIKPVHSAGMKKARPGSGMRSRGVGGPVTSSIEPKKSSKRSSRKNPTGYSVSSPEQSSTISSSLSSPGKSSDSTKNRLKDFGFSFKEADSDQQSYLTEEPDLLNDVRQTKSKSNLTDQKSLSSLSDKDDNIYLNNSLDRSSSRRSRSNSAKQKDLAGSKVMADAQRSTSPKKTFGDLEMDDVDDLEEDLGEIQLGPSFMKSKKYVDARPLTLKKASELKSLIFGSPSGCFNEEWMKQGFPFNDRPDLEFGIVQHKGGSCGVLASVQACFLQNLLFMDDRIISPGDLRPGKREQNKCLAKTLAKILWQCGSEKRVILAMPSGKVQFTTGGRYKGDSLTETLMLYHFTSLPDLEEYLNINIGFFINPTGNGVVVFLYSVIFSKSLEGIIDEMDEPTNQLMGHHNYCTQEMVNLILTGRAVSNVFNDIMELDSGTGPKCILKGLNKRSDVGLLSLFEHYGSCKVGSYYKTPRLPVWVICSESHFSVLFSLKRNLLSDWKAERNFDLYYYDGLSNQEEAIRLSVNTIASCPPSDDGDLVPPMEHCIRTKWPDALIDWNGTEPIL